MDDLDCHVIAKGQSLVSKYAIISQWVRIIRNTYNDQAELPAIRLYAIGESFYNHSLIGL